MNKKGVLLKDIPCTLNQILKCLSVNTDNNDIIYRWIELLKKYNYVTETDGIYVCKIEIYEKGLKYGWEEVEYLWKGKLDVTDLMNCHRFAYMNCHQIDWFSVISQPHRAAA